MTRWMLDDGPLDQLARHLDAATRLPTGLLHVADAVAVAGTQSPGRTALLAMANGAQLCITAHEVVVGTPVGDMVLQHLRRSAAHATRDLGEDESIALCALVLTDAVFVTADKGAAYQALVELGPCRVASPYDLWAALRDLGIVSQIVFGRLCRETTSRAQATAGVPFRLR